VNPASLLSQRMRAFARIPEIREQKRRARENAKRMEAFGRKPGAVHGSYVTDLAELRQTILLCWACDAKWRGSEGRYQYAFRKDWNESYGGAIGKCDACKEVGPKRRVYIHQSYLGKV